MMVVGPKSGVGGRGAVAVYAEPTERELAEMTAEALSYLRAIIRSCPEGRAMGNGIAASSRVLEYARWREEFDYECAARQLDPAALLSQLLGDERKLLTWMRAQLPKLEAKLGDPAVAGDTKP
jgi:hypothetical protein